MGSHLVDFTTGYDHRFHLNFRWQSSLKTGKNWRKRGCCYSLDHHALYWTLKCRFSLHPFKNVVPDFPKFLFAYIHPSFFSGHPHFDYLDSHLILTIISAAHLPSLGPLGPPRIVFVQGFYLCKAIRFQNLIGGGMEILDISNDQKWLRWEKSVFNDGYILINRSFVAWV